jgi:hypothetical protein
MAFNERLPFKGCTIDTEITELSVRLSRPVATFALLAAMVEAIRASCPSLRRPRFYGAIHGHDNPP